jgi:hypothetical protein
LKDQEIAGADVVAWNGDGVRRSGVFDNRALSRRLGSSTYLNVNFFPLMVVVVMMMRESKDTISRTVETMAE